MKKLAVAGLAALLALSLGPRREARAWGHTAHASLMQLAIEALPAGELRTFFSAHASWMVAHASDPDAFRLAHEPTEGPHHYLRSDVGGMDPATYPHAWPDVVLKFKGRAPVQGKLPWTIDEHEKALVAAFQSKDAKSVTIATWLGHYTCDAHVPLHVCTNADGELTGQTGVHGLWEEDMVRAHAAELESAVRAALPAGGVSATSSDVVAWTFHWVETGQRLGLRILDVDRPNATRPPAARRDALWAGTQDIARARLLASAVDLATLWYTAWVKAGKPALPDPVTLDAKPTLPPVPDALGAGTAPPPTAHAEGLVERLDEVLPPEIAALSFSGDAKGPPVVSTVDSESEYALAGLAPGDTIVSVGGEKVGSLADLAARLHASSGHRVRLVVRRGEEDVTLHLKAGER